MPDASPLDSEAGLRPPRAPGLDLVEMIWQPDWKTILLDLARTEKMDPWNINVSELAQKYLAEVLRLRRLTQ